VGVSILVWYIHADMDNILLFCSNDTLGIDELRAEEGKESIHLDLGLVIVGWRYSYGSIACLLR
jgi:hypothetical protein